jgi:hypothetical protein
VIEPPVVEVIHITSDVRMSRTSKPRDQLNQGACFMLAHARTSATPMLLPNVTLIAVKTV